MKVGLAAGHTTDATKDQVWEHHRCLESARLLGRILEAAGATVLPAPDGLYSLHNDVALREKVRYFNEHPCDIVLELHANAGGGSYSTAIYWDGPTSHSEHGKAAASAICQQFASGLPWRSIGARPQSYFKRDLYLLNKTRAPSVIVEPCFYDHPEQRPWLSSAAGTAAYASMVATGLLRWWPF